VGHALCLQPWTNIKAVAAQVVTQHNRHWADIAGYDRAGIYLDVSQCSGQGTSSVTLALQTAPDPDEDVFSGGTPAQIALYTFTGTPTVGLYPIQIVARASLSRFVRWQLTFGTVATSIHFRIWLNLYQAGW
jgi:hypothetical protein